MLKLDLINFTNAAVNLFDFKFFFHFQTEKCHCDNKMLTWPDIDIINPEMKILSLVIHQQTTTTTISFIWGLKTFSLISISFGEIKKMRETSLNLL